jgi:hypothetical protein
MAVKLSDGGHLAKLANGSIVRYDKSGTPIETLKPGDTGYGYWFGLVSRPEDERQRK